MTAAMFESREDGIKRLRELRKKIMFANSDEEAKEILEHFEPVLALNHKEVAELNRAILRHVPPQKVKEVLDEMLMKLEP